MIESRDIGGGAKWAIDKRAEGLTIGTEPPHVIRVLDVSVVFLALHALIVHQDCDDLHQTTCSSLLFAR